jgi:Zn finger protein HypA/HybF involved in hydrogenase expression
MATKHFCPHCDKEVNQLVWRTYCDICGNIITDNKQIMIMAQILGNFSTEQRQTIICPTCMMPHVEILCKEMKQVVYDSAEVPK